MLHNEGNQPNQFPSVKHRSAFTLIELLVVIAILAVLAVVVVLTLNPAGLLQESRDANRVSDMTTLNTAISLYSADGGTALGSSSVVYVSIPDPTATSTAGDQCQGLGLPTLPATYTYQCAATSTYRSTNGTGWIPVNLSAATFGTPLPQLPIDPINTSSSRHYYTYAANGTQFEVTASMESTKYKLGGSGDVISGDGGTLASVYEKGSKLGLEPLDYGDSSLVGLWTFDEGTGTIAYDYSGMNVTGTLMSSPTWVSGKVGSNALSFDGSTNYTKIVGFQNFSGDFTVASWVYITASTTIQQIPLTLMGDWNGPTMPPVLRGWGIASYECDGMTSGNPTRGPGSSGLATSTWLMVACSDTGGTATIYVNGVAVSSGPLVNTPTPGTTTIYAARNIGGYYFTGQQDDERIYTRALSAAEIKAMYNGGK
jgi:prepilin-type N-terminal cleavage/methylation domain-containing protein